MLSPSEWTRLGWGQLIAGVWGVELGDLEAWGAGVYRGGPGKYSNVLGSN